MKSVIDFAKETVHVPEWVKENIKELGNSKSAPISSYENPYVKVIEDFFDKDADACEDDLGVDLQELDLKMTEVRKEDVDKALSDLDRIISKTKESEEGIDLDLLDQRKELKTKITRELQEKKISQNEKMKEAKKKILDAYEEEYRFAKKRFEDCSSEELNKRTEEELHRKKEDDKMYHYIQKLLKSMEDNKDLYAKLSEWKVISMPDLCYDEVFTYGTTLKDEK